MGDVYVGVDGSPASRAALAYAAEEAEFRNAQLVLLHVYESRAPAAESSGYSVDRDVFGLQGMTVHSAEAPGPADEVARRSSIRKHEQDYQRSRARVESDEQQARSIVDEMLAELDEGRRQRATSMLVRSSEPAQALIDTAHGAELLVLGMRRRSPVGKAFLGSVVQDVLLGAECPVLAVKAGPDETRRR